MMSAVATAGGALSDCPWKHFPKKIQVKSNQTKTNLRIKPKHTFTSNMCATRSNFAERSKSGVPTWDLKPHWTPHLHWWVFPCNKARIYRVSLNPWTHAAPNPLYTHLKHCIEHRLLDVWIGASEMIESIWTGAPNLVILQLLVITLGSAKLSPLQ